MQIHEKIKQRRLNLRLSQRKVAMLADIREQTYIDIEHGKSWQRDTMLKILTVLDMRLDVAEVF